MDYCNQLCVDEQDWDEFDNANYDVCFAECLNTLGYDPYGFDEEDEPDDSYLICIENCLTQEPPTGETLDACLDAC